MTFKMMLKDIYIAVDEYLFWLKDNTGKEALYKIDPYSEIGSAAVNILTEYKLIKSRGNGFNFIVDITKNGIECVNENGIENYIKKLEKDKVPYIQNIHTGDNITGAIVHGDVHRSDLSTKARNFSNPIPNNTADKKSITSKIVIWIAKNMVQIIIAVLSGLIVAAISYKIGLNNSCNP